MTDDIDNYDYLSMHVHIHCIWLYLAFNKLKFNKATQTMKRKIVRRVGKASSYKRLRSQMIKLQLQVLVERSAKKTIAH